MVTSNSSPSTPPDRNDNTDICRVLPPTTVAAAAGAHSATPSDDSRALFTGCAYALSTGGTVDVDVSTARGDTIYSAVYSGGGYSTVAGLGEQAAFDSAARRLIAYAGPTFVEVTMTGSGTSQDVRSAAIRLVGDTFTALS